MPCPCPALPLISSRSLSGPQGLSRARAPAVSISAGTTEKLIGLRDELSAGLEALEALEPLIEGWALATGRARTSPALPQSSRTCKTLSVSPTQQGAVRGGAGLGDAAAVRAARLENTEKKKKLLFIV